MERDACHFRFTLSFLIPTLILTVFRSRVYGKLCVKHIKISLYRDVETPTLVYLIKTCLVDVDGQTLINFY